MIKWITVVALLASTERKRYSVSWCHNRSHVDCYVTTLLYDQTMVCVVRRANTDVRGCRDARYFIYDTKKTIFTAIICVYRAFYGLQHQCHTKTAQNRTSPCATLDSIHPTSRRWKKNAPSFCLRSLGQDSNACSLLWIKHALSRDVVANR